MAQLSIYTINHASSLQERFAGDFEALSLVSSYEIKRRGMTSKNLLIDASRLEAKKMLDNLGLESISLSGSGILKFNAENEGAGSTDLLNVSKWFWTTSKDGVKNKGEMKKLLQKFGGIGIFPSNIRNYPAFDSIEIYCRDQYKLVLTH